MAKEIIKKVKEAALEYIKEKNFHLTETEVLESIKLAIESAFDRHSKKIILDIENLSVFELTDSGIQKREMGWIFKYINKRVLFQCLEEHLDRYEREKIFSMFRPSKGQVISADATGETFHLGSKGNVLYSRWGYAGSVANFGIQNGISVEGGKDAYIEIPLKDWNLWGLAKEIYDQTGYCISINPFKKNLRLKKQPPAVVFNINGVDGIMPADERIRGEEYEGKEWEVMLYDVNQTCREDFHLYVSRRQIAYLLRHIESYIPGFKQFVKVKKVAREPGIKSKILVEILEPSFKVSKYKDALSALSEKLNGEKIEFVQNGGSDTEALIRSALNYEEGSLKINYIDKAAIVITDKKGKIIGTNGVNVRLAGMVTDYKITVLTVDEYVNSAIN